MLNFLKMPDDSSRNPDHFDSVVYKVAEKSRLPVSDSSCADQIRMKSTCFDQDFLSERKIASVDIFMREKCATCGAVVQLPVIGLVGLQPGRRILVPFDDDLPSSAADVFVLIGLQQCFQPMTVTNSIIIRVR